MQFFITTLTKFLVHLMYMMQLWCPPAKCALFLDHATKGDTLLCSLGAGHNSICTSIIRNVHVHNLVSTLNSIKDKTGLYTIVESSKYDWLEYANGDTINEDLIVLPNKTVINSTINSHLEDQWVKKWENIKGHTQTKGRVKFFLSQKVGF